MMSPSSFFVVAQANEPAPTLDESGAYGIIKQEFASTRAARFVGVQAVVLGYGIIVGGESTLVERRHFNTIRHETNG